MASMVQVEPIVVTSSTTAVANSDPVETGGNPMELHVTNAPGTNLVSLQVSGDKVNWAATSDVDAAAITTIDAGWYIVRELGKYMRLQISIDAGGPRDFHALFIFNKEGG